MNSDTLRQALRELNGERNARFYFSRCAESLLVANAFLVPEEPDHLIKLSDGRKVFIIEADSVLWVEIG